MILDLLYPRRCPICDRVTGRKDSVCAECENRVRKVSEPSCKKCGKPIQDSRREYCFDCEKKKHFFVQGKALWVYEKKVKESVYRFKYQNKREYGRIYAKEIAEKYGEWIRSKGIQAIVPVPLHKNRRRQRGYNQAEILARELGRCLKIPVRTDILFRVRDTNPQKTLSDTERKNNLKKAFKSTGSIVQLDHILIVDDIYTTGSTLDAAALALLDAGVKEVYTCCISIGQGC